MATPVKVGEKLEFLLQADTKTLDSGIYCEARINGKLVYYADIGSGKGVVRYSAKRYFLSIGEDDSEAHEALTRGFPMGGGDDLTFGVTIETIPGAKTVQTGEEEWATPSKMIIHGTTGPAWGAYRVMWTCGA